MADSGERDATQPPPQMLAPSEVLKGLIYGSIGLGATVVAEAPARLKQARNDLVAARFIGEMAVTQGVAQLKARRDRAASPESPPAGPRRPPRRPVPEPAPATDESSTVDQAGVDEPEVEMPTTDSSAGVADEPAAVSAAELPIPDYDTVPAIDVVAQLEDLTEEERSIVEAYERAHRGRRTVLGKLAQLEGS